MDVFIFVQFAAAALAANALTLWFIYGLWTVTKAEKSGRDPSHAPWSALLGMAVPPLVMAAGAYMLTT